MPIFPPRSRRLTFALLSAALLGIASIAAAAVDDLGLEEPGSTTRPAGSQPASTQPGRIPVFSMGRPAGSAIAPHELDELIARARKLQPPGKALWYFELDLIRMPAGQRDFRAVAHYAPDETAGRFRKGRSLTLWSPGLEMQIAMAKQRMADEGGPVDEKADADPFQHWCQVAPTGKPFVDEIDPLRPALMPFKLPRDLKPEEIIRVVDFARTSPNTIEDPSKEPWANVEFNGTEQLLDIRREADGSYELRTIRPSKGGGPGGQILRCKVKNEKLKVVDIMTWVP